MRQRPLGSSGLRASVVAFGAWAVGGWRWGGTDEAQAVDALRAGLDAGITLVDTAPVYGFGRGEELVGRAFEGRRDRVVIATKCGLSWDSDLGSFFFAADELGRSESGSIRIHKYCGADAIRSGLEASLRRLRTDRVDLYLTHWQDPTTPVEDTMDVLLDLKRQGKILAIGACNASGADLDRYASRGPLDADQERFSLVDRQAETANLPWCRANGAAFLAYSPLAHGLLTGKAAGRSWAPGDLRNDLPRFRPDGIARAQGLAAKLGAIAAARGVTVAQLVIAWTLSRPGVTHALVGARTPAQALENAAAGNLVLSDAELAAIDRAGLESGL